MNKNNYNSGELRVGKERKNRYVSSSFINDTKKSSIAIIASILVLAMVTCTFFAMFGGFNVKIWKPLGANPNNDLPTFNEPSAPTYIASEGGKGLYQLDLSSDYAILVRISDMTTLAHKYADEVIYPASMTKVMTVLVALDLIENLDDEYVIKQDVVSQIAYDAANAGLKDYVGQTITIRDILYGISYCSAADSVMCLLDYLGLSVKEFVALMNEKATAIGMQNSTFGGAIGMDSEHNQTTCRDIAALMIYAMEDSVCLGFFSGTEYKPTFMVKSYYHSTLNTTLGEKKYTPETVLGEKYTVVAAKSGYEINAGRCLVSYIKNDETGEYFVLVTANAKETKYNTIKDMQAIFDEINP